jgi:hypothetical protein
VEEGVADHGIGPSEYAYPAHSSGLPEYDYPEPLFIRNTFIENSLDKFLSLEGFYCEREIRSCPNSGLMGAPLPVLREEEATETTVLAAASAKVPFAKSSRLLQTFPELPELPEGTETIEADLDQSQSQGRIREPAARSGREISAMGTPPGFAPEGDCTKTTAPADPQGKLTGKSDEVKRLEELIVALQAENQALKASISLEGLRVGSPPVQAAPTAVLPPAPAEWAPVLLPAAGAGLVPPPPTVLAESVVPPAVAAAASPGGPPEPLLGSPELPTMGSAGHCAGICKPCAFFHKKGCSNGIRCFFCHLCGPGEVRRRKMLKMEQRRHEEMAGAFLGGSRPIASY